MLKAIFDKLKMGSSETKDETQGEPQSQTQGETKGGTQAENPPQSTLREIALAERVRQLEQKIEEMKCRQEHSDEMITNLRTTLSSPITLFATPPKRPGGHCTPISGHDNSMNTWLERHSPSASRGSNIVTLDDADFRTLPPNSPVYFSLTTAAVTTPRESPSTKRKSSRALKTNNANKAPPLTADY